MVVVGRFVRKSTISTTFPKSPPVCALKIFKLPPCGVRSLFPPHDVTQRLRRLACWQIFFARFFFDEEISYST